MYFEMNTKNMVLSTTISTSGTRNAQVLSVVGKIDLALLVCFQNCFISLGINFLAKGCHTIPKIKNLTTFT